MPDEIEANVQHLYIRLNDLLSEGQPDPRYPDSAEATWRMQVIIRWWLQQMGAATDYDAPRVMAVLVGALQDMGIMAEAIAVPPGEIREPRVQ